jgi:dihydrolipoamide dehydrogenase
MLVQKAEEEGAFVVETINGQKTHINYRLIPGLVYQARDSIGWLY